MEHSIPQYVGGVEKKQGGRSKTLIRKTGVVPFPERSVEWSRLHSWSDAQEGRSTMIDEVILASEANGTSQ